MVCFWFYGAEGAWGFFVGEKMEVGGVNKKAVTALASEFAGYAQGREFFNCFLGGRESQR